MTILHIPIAHGHYHEDGVTISDLVFESEEEALNHGDKMVESSTGHSQFYVKEVEMVESERP